MAISKRKSLFNSKLRDCHRCKANIRNGVILVMVNSKISDGDGPAQVVCTACGLKGQYCGTKGSAVYSWNNLFREKKVS
jgi:hypothetical protein